MRIALKGIGAQADLFEEFQQARATRFTDVQGVNVQCLSQQLRYGASRVE